MLVVVACSMVAARAQSSDVAAPSPVRANEITGNIAARDIGDARLTDHYYAFTGTPGDVLITVDVRNLDGDIDVFTLTGLRPLLKISVYSSSSAPITKGIYLRKREDLILRIEARSPNDDEGTYRIRFGGSFEPITNGPLAETPTPLTHEPPSLATGKKGRRVSSVGARIEEPPAEVAAVPSPEPTPTSTTPSETTAKPTDSTETAKAEAPRPAARPPRGRRGVNRRTRTPPPRVDESVAKAETPTDSSTEEPPTAPATTPGRRTTTRGSNARRTKEETPADANAPAESGPRLIIETTEGTLINRYMSSVRRVTIENNQVVVVGKDGKIDRIPLASLLRMTVAP